MSKTKFTRKKKKNIYLVYLFIIIIPVAYYFLFIMNSDEISRKDANKYLVGSWLRTDGAYTITITEVKEDGLIDATYFNPDPINVGKAGWKIREKVLQVYVLLDDVNYPGSVYELNYNKEQDILTGTYYQATMKQTYEVSFRKQE